MFEQFLAVLTRIAVALENGAAPGATSAAASTPADSAPAATESKATGTRGGKGKGAATSAPAKTAPTAEETNAALTELRTYIDEAEGDKKGLAAAREVMDEIAGVSKMAEIPEDKRAAIIKAANEKLEAYKATQSESDEM